MQAVKRSYHKLLSRHQARNMSRIPQGMVGQALFQSPQQRATPPGFTPPREPARFHTPPSHYNNPVTNVRSATRYLAKATIHGNTPEDQAARDAIELRKTAVAQQAQYSHGFSY